MDSSPFQVEYVRLWLFPRVSGFFLTVGRGQLASQYDVLGHKVGVCSNCVVLRTHDAEGRFMYHK
jgi:hypothetical protein